MTFNYDAVITEVGGRGKYQMVRYIVLACIPIAMSWHLVGNTLITAAPAHTCVPPSLQDEDDSTHLIADFQCISPVSNSLHNYSIDVMNKEHLDDDVQKSRLTQLHRMMVQWDEAFTTADQECHLVDYSGMTKGFSDINKAEAVCAMLKDVALNGVKHEYLTNGADNSSRAATTLETLNSYNKDYHFKNSANCDSLDGEKKVKCLNENFGMKRPCTEWTYDQRHYTETVVTEFNLVCSEYVKIQFLQVGVMIGVFIGAIGFGKMSDSMGRSKCLTAALITSFFGMFFAGMAPNYWALFICRAINGAGAIGAISSSFVLTGEIFEPDSRVMALQVAQALFGVGQALLAIIGYYVPYWRTVSIILSIPTAIGFAIPFFMDESARWLVSMKRTDEAEAILHKIARVNGQEFRGLESHGVTKDACDDDEPQAEAGFMSFFRTPRMRARTLNLFYQWFMLSGVYYGLTMNATSLAGDPFLNLGISGLIEVPAELLAGVLFMKIGRRWSMIFFNFMGGLACMLMMFVESGSTASIILPLCGKFALTGGYGGIYVYTAELFPTTLRNGGIGLCSSVARIGGICAPLIALLAIFGQSIPYIIFGALGLLGAFLTMFLPEVLDRKLPDTVEEGERFGEGEPTAMEDLSIMVKSLFRTANTQQHAYDKLQRK